MTPGALRPQRYAYGHHRARHCPHAGGRGGALESGDILMATAEAGGGVTAEVWFSNDYGINWPLAPWTPCRQTKTFPAESWYRLSRTCGAAS